MVDITTKVEWLNIVGDAQTWRSLGLTVLEDGAIPLLGTSLRIVAPRSDTSESELPAQQPSLADSGGDGQNESGGDGQNESGGDGQSEPGGDGQNESGGDGQHGSGGDGQSEPGGDGQNESGIAGWALSGVGQATTDGLWPISIDGLCTDIVAPSTPRFVSHDLGASGLDHVVVLTPDLERTSAAITEATQCELKRVREVGSMRQGFHRIGRGGLIVELVERPDIAEGSAEFWGLVLIVDDLDHACAQIGADRVSGPKDAVQPGRRIATIRGDVGLGLPGALMTP